jgi:hypothetical protein
MCGTTTMHHAEEQVLAMQQEHEIVQAQHHYPAALARAYR